MEAGNTTFFDCLFDGKIVWAFHTAMTCDLAYVSALVKKQQGADSVYGRPDCAFFYDYNPNKGRSLTCKMKSPDFAVADLVKYTYRLGNEKSHQTHHAKISLICYENERGRQYRLAVYSKNLEFSNNIDAALLFQLQVGEKETESGVQLLSYIDKLHSIAEEKGKEWLTEHITDDVRSMLKRVSLISEFASEDSEVLRHAQLYFGGRDSLKASLGELLDLASVKTKADELNDSSMVLTPPEFIRDTDAEGFFREHKILYDVSKEAKLASHIKLYLLNRESAKAFELWVGSANATNQGLGWDFKNNQKSNYTSIECLVKFELESQGALCKMRNSIMQGKAFNNLPYEYNVFDFSNETKEGSLQITPDELGPYVVNNYECTGITFEKECGKINVVLKGKENRKSPPDGIERVPWRPLEYSKYGYGDLSIGSDEIILEYEFEKFEKTQGILVFGTGCSILDVSEKLPAGVERRKDKLVKDTRLTDWLLNPGCMPQNSEPKWERELIWNYEVLKGNHPAALTTKRTEDDSQLSTAYRKSISCAGSVLRKAKEGTLPKAQPMKFQVNAANRLCSILEQNSRAFLADEPGLGKTFTSAMIMKKLAEQKREKNEPFYVIYVAPNLALVENNGSELVRKYKAVSDDDNIVLLLDWVNHAESLKTAYTNYYCLKIKEREEAGEKIREKTDKRAQLNKDMLEPDIARQILDRILPDYQLKRRSPIDKEKVVEYIVSSSANANSTLKNAVGLSADKWADFKSHYVKTYYTILQENDIGKLKGELEAVLYEINNKLKEDKNIFQGSRTKIKNFVNALSGDKNHSYPNWNGKLSDYYPETSIPDRLSNVNEILNTNGHRLQGKTILITISAEVALGEVRSEIEKNKFIIDGKRFESRDAFTRTFLEKYKPGLIIWDEYHRYIEKLKGGNVFFDYEIKSNEGKIGMKSLFVSATPYRTNVSGKDNEEALKELYKNALDDESQDAKLPSFEVDFSPLFCGGVPAGDVTRLNDVYKRFTEGGEKDILQAILKERMVRNERTRLRKNYEPHNRIFTSEEQYTKEYAEILKNTALQCRNLQAANYPDGALKWSLSLPWVLCFSTDRTSAKNNNISKKSTSYFELLYPKSRCSPELFVYADDGNVKEEMLKTLPKQNLAMHQICKMNISDRRAAQLLWMPPTVPLYHAGESSIFTEFSDYSKLLVFAEFRYLQRGGARLLSDYCRLLCKNDGESSDIPQLKIESMEEEDVFDRYLEADDLLAVDYREQSLEDVLQGIEIDERIEDEENGKLYLIASPFMCLKRLYKKEMGILKRKIRESGKLEKELKGYQAQLVKLKNEIRTTADAFNEYFNSPGVKEALWSWLVDNDYSTENKREKGLLRYCAEGNLYAVLEEWVFCMKDSEPEKQMEFMQSVLRREHSKVGVQTHKSTISKEHEDGKVMQCGIAEQLTGDIGDVGSGQKEETKDCVNAFNSPFYPMIMFAGRGAQEGIDMHNYCMRIMHLTLPKGAVSFEQRNGRIDRYRSLLIRRRAAEYTEGIAIEENSGCAQLMLRIFEYLSAHKDENEENREDIIYPNWSIRNVNSRWSFEELMPAWDYTEESCFISILDEMQKSYRESMGAHNHLDSIDLSTIY